MKYVIRKDIQALPLAELGRQFLALRNLSWSKHVLAEKAKGEPLTLDQLASSFRSLGSVEELELEVLISRFCESYEIPKNATWFFPQALAVLSKIKLTKNESGKISASSLMREYSKDNFIMGIYTLFVHAKRGLLLKNQTTEPSRNFCKLVPLVMSAYKQYANVQYSEWDPEEIHLVVDKDLAESMKQVLRIEQDGYAYECLMYRKYLPKDWSFEYDDMVYEHNDFGVEDIMKWRNDALTVKSGAKVGTIRNPLSTYSLSPSEDNPVKHLDILSRHMFLQTWCAHPDNRTSLMVVDALDWDNQPKPYVNVEFLHNSLEKEAELYLRALEDTKVEIPW